MKENKIKELYEYCEKYNLTEKEKEELSEYIDIVIKETEELQNKINLKNIVNLIKNIELFKGKENDNKKNS
jgi:hypothetical protein